MLFWFIYINFIFILLFILNKNQYYFIWIIFAITGSIRYRVGTDYISYEEIYDSVVANELVPVEFGYQWLIYITESIGGNAQMLFLITFSITIYLFYNSFTYYLKYINKQSYMPIVILLFILILYFFAFTSVRQILAISIFFYATRYIMQNNFILYFILLISASFIHISILIMLPFYFLINIKFSRKFIFLYLLISSVFFIVNPLSYISYLLSLLGSSYARFFEIVFYTEVGSSNFKVILTFITIFVILFFLRYLNRNNKLENITFNIILIFITVRIISLHMDVFNRLSNTFKPFLILFFIFVIIKLLKNKSTKKFFLFSLLIIMLIVNLIVITEKANRNGFFDHYTINMSFFGKEKSIIKIYGNHENYRKGTEE